MRQLALLLAFLTPLASAQSHLWGENPQSHFGSAVARAGDLDGDGSVDVIVGAPGDETNGLGAGSLTAISLSKKAVLWRHYGSKPGDRLGASVSAVGDVDQDGFDDVLVGIPQDDTAVGEDAGGARLVSGKDGSTMYHWTGYRKFDQFGTSVAGGMDVDHDGIPDMLVGAVWGGDSDPLNGKSQQGEVHVISGKGLNRILVVEGEFFGDDFGRSVAFLGDVDGDQVPDWAAGAPFAEREGTRLGYVQVRSGKSGALVQRIPGPQHDARFGWSVAGAGDVNLDGIPDLVVGAPHFVASKGTRDGRAQVFSVLEYQILNDVVGTSASELGTSVAGIGNAGGGQGADILLGAPYHSSGGLTARGAAVVWEGNVTKMLDLFEGDTAFIELGAAVCGLGNINRGWKPEVLLGAPRDDQNGLAAGAVVVKSIK